MPLPWLVIINWLFSRSRKFADKFGWDHSDMIKHTVYGDYYKQKNKVMEKVEETGMFSS